MKGYLFQVSGICKNIVIFWVDLIEKSRKTNTRISRLRQSQQNGRMEKPESGIQSRKRNPNPNPNLRNKNWRRFCLESVTNNNCSIKTFHPHIIFIYCYYIFYCRIFCVRRKIFLREFHIRVSVATWDHDWHEYSSSLYGLSLTMDETRSPFTAVTTNTRPRGVFSSIHTCVFVDVNQPLPWFFTRWPSKILSPFLHPRRPRGR